MGAAPWSLRGFVDGWNRFFHAPRDSRPAALVRMGFALCLFAHWAVLYPDLDRWFTEGGMLPAEASREVTHPSAWSILWLLPETPSVVAACFWITVGQTLLLLVGILPRLNALCLYAWILSWQHRNPLLVDGEDTLMKLLAFYLIWIPSGQAWSVQSALARWWRGGRWPRAAKRTTADTRPSPFPEGEGATTSVPPEYAIPGWGLRLLQIQMSVMLLATGLGKLQGDRWLDGTALYYVARLDDFFGRLPMPTWPFDDPWAVAVLTWTVIVAEVGLPFLVWFRETRRVALVALLCFHLGNEWMMHLFLFHWLMLAGWLSFLDSSDFRWWKGRSAPAASEGR